MGRATRINTTENFDSQSELKTELGRQNELEEVSLEDEGPWNEDFFAAFEALLRDFMKS
jgi:hypothetical protein